MKNNNSLVLARLVANESEWEQIRQIRKEVFVVEQQVSESEEFDEFEEICRHFIAFYEGQPCGAARWRFTEKGIKLERFAVLAKYRSKNVGSALVQAVLEDIANSENTKDKILYLHAQVSAMNLYAKFGFQPVGEMFDECNIQHYKMLK